MLKSLCLKPQQSRLVVLSLVKLAIKRISTYNDISPNEKDDFYAKILSEIFNTCCVFRRDDPSKHENFIEKFDELLFKKDYPKVNRLVLEIDTVDNPNGSYSSEKKNILAIEAINTETSTKNNNKFEFSNQSALDASGHKITNRTNNSGDIIKEIRNDTLTFKRNSIKKPYILLVIDVTVTLNDINRIFIKVMKDLGFNITAGHESSECITVEKNPNEVVKVILKCFLPKNRSLTIALQMKVSYSINKYERMIEIIGNETSRKTHMDRSICAFIKSLSKLDKKYRILRKNDINLDSLNKQLSSNTKTGSSENLPSLKNNNYVQLKTYNSK